MAEEFFIPKLGQTVEEVTIINWLVEDGAKVSLGDEILEVETDKAVFPVAATAKGVLHIGPYKKGDIVPVLTVVAVIGAAGERFEDHVQAGRPPAAAPPAPQGEAPAGPVEALMPPDPDLKSGQKLFASPRARMLASAKKVDLSEVTATGGGGARIAERDVQAYLGHQPKATPLAARLAAKQQVDLRAVSGSGPQGRITRQDVQQALGSPTAPGAALEPEVMQRQPLEGVRAIIAGRMAASVGTTARVTLFTEVDATHLVEARQRLKAEVGQEWGFEPGYNDLLAVIVARALRDFPYMNARLSADGKSIEQLSAVNLGMAVDTERGLLVPVVHGADQIGLRAFGSTFRQLVERARAGRSLPDDLSGGTFTITNLGMYDIDGFTPVINLPETAILGVGRIQRKPVFVGEQVVGRHLLVLSLVFDHRLVDGAPAARYLQRIKRLIENPFLLLA